MRLIKGFPADPGNNYQLNVIKLMEHAIRNFSRQEIISRRNDGTLFRYTYKDSYLRMKKLANALETLGVNIGDRIGVVAWNSHKHFEIYFGLPGMGAVMVSLNMRLAPQDLSHVINHSGLKVIFLEDDLIPVIEQVSELTKNVEKYIIITNKDLSEIETTLYPIFSYESILTQASEEYEWPYLDENSSYAACYSSGTTGKPKGVYYSHRNVYIQAMMFAAQFSLSVNDVVFQMVPMFHVLGWSKPQAATYVGAKLIFSGRWNLDDLDLLSELMVNEKVTVSAAVPAVYIAMLEKFKKKSKKPDFRRARFICGGAEPPISLMKDMWDYTGAEIIHSYGSTEAMAITTLNMFKPWLRNELNDEELWELKKKQGMIMSGIDVKIVDENGNILPHDGKSSGEILLRGPWITRSYFNAPETRDRFTPDGFFKTGDAGLIDSEGLLKITDRIKDVIKSGGEWISSIDMENFLVSHISILEAAVVGISHPKWDERPLALIKLRDRSDRIEKEEIKEYLLKKFAKWQLPEDLLYVDEIPKTSVGKLDKKVIREMYKEFYSKR
ncbi:MAG: long-chain-fatty-acid--CoA ligase [Promethearchaeota archaeon]